MPEAEKTKADASEKEIVITRIFDAPRALVWKAFMEADLIARWWGPEGFTTRVEAHEARPGGKWRYVMVGPDGKNYPADGIFREIVPNERFVTTDEFGEDHPREGSTDLPSGMVITATFKDEGKRTRLTLRVVSPTAEDRKKLEELGMVAGWNSSFDCLDKLLAELAA